MFCVRKIIVKTLMAEDSSIDEKSKKLKRMRFFAGLILLVMVVMYAVARTYEEEYSWMVWLRAFAEAGMVGGLADWFAVTALFRHPLGLPIPHTAVIPRGKDRIGKSFAEFIHGNFLTAERICDQAKSLRVVPRMAQWMVQQDNADRLAKQVVQTIPVALNAMEKYEAHQRMTQKLLDQLKVIKPDEVIGKLTKWLLSENRYRHVLAPLLAQMAKAISSNKASINNAAGENAPLSKVPLLGSVSRALAESMSGRATGNMEESLIAASEDDSNELWDSIELQLTNLQTYLSENDELRCQLGEIRDQWLVNQQSGELADRLWKEIRASLDRDLSSDKPQTVAQLAELILSMGSSIEQNEELSNNIEKILLEGVADILNQHGAHLQTMIRNTIEEWDADTLMYKLENQVGSDLQFIRINGTLIGGVVGLTLHAVGMLIW